MKRPAWLWYSKFKYIVTHKKHINIAIRKIPYHDTSRIWSLKLNIGGPKEFNYTIFQAHDYIVAFSVILEPSKKLPVLNAAWHGMMRNEAAKRRVVSL